MRYVGNTALSPQIQERIQSTFQQTLSLAEEGNRQEALLGCDFILRLDPLFEPARTLQGRLNEGEGPVDTGNLMGEAPAEAAPSAPDQPVALVEPEAPGPIAAELDAAPIEIDDTVVEPPVDLGEPMVEPLVEVGDPAPDSLVDIGELVDGDAFDEPGLEADASLEVSLPTEPEVEAPEPQTADDLPSRMAMLFEQRNFQDLMSLAMENQERISGDSDLKQIVDAASERLEAEPYVRNFLDSAQAAKEKGDLDGARAHLDKARELDPSHPVLVVLTEDVERASMVEPPATFEPPPLAETPPLVEPDAFEAPALDVEDLFTTEEEPVGEPAVSGPTVEAPGDEIATPEIAQTVPSLDAEPSARLDNESEQRIDELLKEGQESFEEGQYQTAIDAWSRIFLIDIDHAEASRRIELARKLKAEVERQVEEAFHEGISLLESGNQEKAVEAFNKVLEIQPNHMGARDYLDKLSSGDLGAPSRTPVPDLSPVPDEAPAESALAATTEVDDLGSPIAGPAAVSDDLAPEEFEAAPKPAPSKGRSFALIGAAVLVLVLAIGWFVWSKWESFFPGSAPAEEAATAEARVDPIERARELHEAGNTAMAINVLRRLARGHEQYAEAMALIAMWEAGDQEVVEESQGPSEELLARRQDLAIQAQRAVANGENILGLDLLEEANQISLLSEEEMGIHTQATNSLVMLEEQLDIFDQGDWEYSLPSLWRMHDADSTNKDVLRLMVDSYYNLGLRDLQRGDTKAALEKLEEARELAENDRDLDRLAEFASAYEDRPSDMLYRIFVKYQKFR